MFHRKQERVIEEKKADMVPALLFFLHLSALSTLVISFPEEGKLHCTLDQEKSWVSVPKSLFTGSKIFIEIVCNTDIPDSKITINLSVLESHCWNDRSAYEDSEKYLDPANIRTNRSSTPVVAQEITTNCSGHIMLSEMIVFGGKGPPGEEVASGGQLFQGERTGKLPEENNQGVENLKKTAHTNGEFSAPLFIIPKDGFYILALRIQGLNFKADVEIRMLSSNGYLSAADWPLLPFYGIMCIVYVIFGIVWLIVSFCQWRELLRIQFWIGAVILLGMLEKATFYAEYQNINSTGINVKAVVLLAEWVSCAKRTLARMLVIIVSLGFGIVKPRLGSMLHRLVGVGACYFIFAVVESYIRVMHPKNDPSNQLLIASIPLALLNSAICWWIFTALIQTTRTLRLRRNLVKLSLYRHFTNTLVFAVLASVVFMLYSIKVHRLAVCVTDWKNFWVDDAYWHILFSVLLLVIMVLWRPTNNNQRYAFTPLLDAAEDDEEEDLFVNDAYGVKMRTHSRPTSPKPKPGNDEDILKWVDENIPSAGVETALPIFDSEEEILTTKYEMSKMQ